jgi:hypothetical protein
MLCSRRFADRSCRRGPLAAASIALLASAVGGMAFAQQQKRWAAIDPNTEATSPVAWGESVEEARQRAMDACSKVSKSCAGQPATTMHATDVFALMCCNKPQLGCAAAAAPTREEALRSVEEIFAAGGYSNCSLRHYIAAKTGERERDAPKRKARPAR